MCANGEMEGVIQKGHEYRIPVDAKKPVDKRKLPHKGKYGRYAECFRVVDIQRLELEAMPPLSAKEAQRAHDDFTTDFVYQSNALAGNSLTRDETALVLLGRTIDGKAQSEQREACGLRDALSHIEERARKKTGLTQADLRTLHALAMTDQPDTPSFYRCIPDACVRTELSPTQPVLVAQRMTELLAQNEKREKTLHPLERIALLYLEFAEIRPFPDGNGRIGRLMINLELLRCGYPAISISPDDRRRHEDAFAAFARNGKGDQMVRLVAAQVDQRLTQALAAHKGK